MKPTHKTPPLTRWMLASKAERDLRAAYRGFVDAGCPQVAKRLRATLKSAQGAVRNALLRTYK